MATRLYDDLTQRLPRILEPKYPQQYFENGELIPTRTDLVPGARQVAWESISEFGDAELIEDAARNIPVVNISVEEDRYNIWMVASGFPFTLQEDRAYRSDSTLNSTTSQIDRFERRMQAARKVIVQRIHRLTAAGRPDAGFQGILNNSSVQVESTTFNPYSATFQDMVDYTVSLVEGMTDNLVTAEPTTFLVSSDFRARMMSVLNAQGTRSVYSYIKELYPGLEIKKILESTDAWLTQNGVQHTAGHDRFLLYPTMEDVIHRHIESSIAQLAPEDYVRVDGNSLRKIYPLFSCFTEAIIDYPQDCRYISIPKKS